MDGHASSVCATPQAPSSDRPQVFPPLLPTAQRTAEQLQQQNQPAQVSNDKQQLFARLSSQLLSTPASGHARTSIQTCSPGGGRGDQASSRKPSAPELMGLVSKRTKPQECLKPLKTKKRSRISSHSTRRAPSPAMKHTAERNPEEEEEEEEEDSAQEFRERGVGRDSAGSLGVSTLLGSFYGHSSRV